MADPTGYARSYSFTNWQASKPKTPLPAHEVDNEFDNVAQAMSETQDALADIRRSDGALQNGIVTFDAMTDDVSDLLSILPEIDAKADEAIAAAAAAAQSQALADAARVQAELAATVAGAPIYPNTTAGLAGTTNGGMFFTPQGGGGFRVWQNAGGVAAHAGYIGAGGTINPMEFGAIGDGVADDGAALNLAFAALRAAATSGNNPIKAPVLDGQSKQYRAPIPVNATAINGFGWTVRDMVIVSEATGKTALDAIGTRGGRWENVIVWGSKTNRPRIGWQAARAAAGGALAFCDNQIFIKCVVDGFFTVASRYAYGQESCIYLGCHWWNRDDCGTTSIVVGSDAGLPAITSDYLAPITGSTSAINNSYVRCEDRTAPWDGIGMWAITGISKANPAVVTCAGGHQLANGETVGIFVPAGMWELDAFVGTVANATATTFELVGVDSTSYGTYTGSGYAVRAQTAPTMIIGRINNTVWHEHYVVNYGTHGVRFVFPDANKPVGIKLGLLVEGAPKSCVQFAAPGFDTSVHGFELDVEQQRVHQSIVSMDPATTGIVRLANGKVVVHNAPHTSRPLISTPDRFAMKNMDLISPLAAEIFTYNFTDFVGTQYAFDQIQKHYHGGYFREPVCYAPIFGDSDGAAWNIPAGGGSFIPADNLGKNIGGLSNRVSAFYGYQIDLGTTSTNGTIIRSGTGAPEGAVTANAGSLYLQTGATAVLWFKKTGTGNTGWVAIA